MNLQIAKWGNSLAVRIPAEMARGVGFVEGDVVQASLTIDGGICLQPKKWDRKAFIEEMKLARNQMRQGTSVIEELRRGGSY
jgi:antitoxin MazE